ncbi:MAG: hypothetical protein KDK39_20115, partial [Leptospiraceae bacterium]|nr:hypothetical protein [Leptospiraceae bacterium]
CIARAADMAGICDEIISNFGIIAQAICDADDVKRGHFRITDRHGIERDFPLPSLSIALVDSRPERIQHIGQAAAIARDLKKKAKDRAGSAWVANYDYP